jgi:predicted Zn-dependent peptidase
MGTTAERMMSARSKRTGGGSGGAFIGFDEKDIKKEFERAFKELENLHDGVTTAQIRRIARKSLKPMVKAYKEEAKAGNKRDFVVYRNGGVYAEIKPKTLSKSMGVITTRVNRGATFASLSVGPRVKRSFSDPEKGGWFAHFLEYGYLQNGNYKSGIQGFARRAKMKQSAGVANEFKRLMRGFLNKQVKAARI